MTSMEPRRVSMVTAPLEKPEPKDELGITIRFTLSLTESNDKTYPEFSYTELLKNAIEERELDENDPFSKKDREEDDKLVALAKSFESKYAPKVGKKKKRRTDRLQDLVDLGEGYDETDPFVDNSEAYDEIVPACLTTKHGGFYINTGSLDFRALSDDESVDAGKMAGQRKKKMRIASDSESEVDGRKKCGPKRKKFKDDIDGVKKKRLKKLSGNGEKIIRRKKLLKEKTRLKDQSGVDPSTAVEQPPKSGTIATTPNRGAEQVGGVSDGDDSCQSDSEPLLPRSVDNMDAIIDSVMSRVSGELPMSTGVASNHQEVPPLPDSLPASLMQAINSIKQAAKDTEEGKCKFFSPRVNAILLQIETESRQLACGVRTLLYAHLGGHLPCSKETLQKRAKKLRLGAQHDPMRDSIESLREAISQCMPRLLEKHQAECIAKAQANQDRLMEKEKSETAAAARELNGSDSDEERSQDSGEKLKRFVPPRKKFEWTPELRTLLCNVMHQKMECVELGKIGSQTPEEYLRAFLDSEIRPLWPQGWIQTRMLFKETRSIHRKWTIGQKQRKNTYATKCALLPPGENKAQQGLPSPATILSTSVVGAADKPAMAVSPLVSPAGFVHVSPTPNVGPIASMHASPTSSVRASPSSHVSPTASVRVSPSSHASPTATVHVSPGAHHVNPPVSMRVSPGNPASITSPPALASPPLFSFKQKDKEDDNVVTPSGQEPVINGHRSLLAGMMDPDMSAAEAKGGYFDAFKAFAYQGSSDMAAAAAGQGMRTTEPKQAQMSTALQQMLSAKQLPQALQPQQEEKLQQQKHVTEQQHQQKLQQQQQQQQQQQHKQQQQNTQLHKQQQQQQQQQDKQLQQQQQHKQQQDKQLQQQQQNKQQQLQQQQRQQQQSTQQHNQQIQQQKQLQQSKQLQRQEMQQQQHKQHQQQSQPIHAQLLQQTQQQQQQQQRQQRSEELVQQQLQQQKKLQQQKQLQQKTSPEQQRKRQRANSEQQQQQSQHLLEELQQEGLLSKEDIARLFRVVQQPAEARSQAVAPPPSTEVKSQPTVAKWASPVTSPVRMSTKSPASTAAQQVSQQKTAQHRQETCSPTYHRDTPSNQTVNGAERRTPDTKTSAGDAGRNTSVSSDAVSLPAHWHAEQGMAAAAAAVEKQQETKQHEVKSITPPFLARQHSQPVLPSQSSPQQQQQQQQQQHDSSSKKLGSPHLQRQLSRTAMPQQQQQSDMLQQQQKLARSQQQLSPQQQQQQQHQSPKKQQLSHQKQQIVQQQILQQHLTQQQQLSQQRQLSQKQQLSQQQQLPQRQQQQQSQLREPPSHTQPLFGQLTLNEIQEQLLASSANFYSGQTQQPQQQPAPSSSASSMPPWTAASLPSAVHAPDYNHAAAIAAPESGYSALGHRVPAYAPAHDIGLSSVSPPCGAGGGGGGSSLAHFRSPSHLPPGSSSLIGQKSITQNLSPHDTHRSPAARASPQSLYMPAALPGQPVAPPSLTYSYPYTDGQHRPHHY